MKGKLHKTDNGWVVRYNQEDHRDPLPELPLHPEYQTILPLDLDLEGKEVILFLQNYLIINFDFSTTKLMKVTKNKDNVWKLRINKDSMRFLDWIYQDKNFNYLSRKYEIYESHKKSLTTNNIP